MRGGLVAEADRPRLSFFFLRRSFFDAVRTRGGTNEVERANILAPGLRRLTSSRTPSSRLHPRTLSGDWPMGSRIQLQQRNCSRFSRDFLRRSTDQTRKELSARSSGLRFRFKIYLISRTACFLSHALPASDSHLNLSSPAAPASSARTWCSRCRTNSRTRG